MSKMLGQSFIISTYIARLIKQQYIKNRIEHHSLFFFSSQIMFSHIGGKNQELEEVIQHSHIF